MLDPFSIEVFTLWGISLAVVSTRTYARWSTVGVREFQVDDYLMVLAVVCSPQEVFPLHKDWDWLTPRASIRWYTDLKQVQDTALVPFSEGWRTMV